PVGTTIFASPVDYSKEPHNILNKETDPDTGWSYHGARWMAPQLARWLTPDPPVKAPDPKFMTAPWDLNPYQYVRQNPVMWWDPNGEWPVGALSDMTVRRGEIERAVERGERKPIRPIPWRLCARAAMAFLIELVKFDEIDMTRMAVAGGAASVDGPLPFGDAAGGIIAGPTIARRFQKAFDAASALLRKGDNLLDALSRMVGPYAKVGGHHIHAKAAFDGDGKYDMSRALCISQEFMEGMGWNHKLMTAQQQRLFAELRASGRPNTMAEHGRIAREALIAGGAKPEEANALINASLQNLADQGVASPARIPWDTQ
ncbi:MAG: RHS repeat-associated core domain-containing protein, partial [Pseudomonadota bacterium]